MALSFQKLNGVTVSKFQLDAAANGVNLKDSSGNLVVRNGADSADATVTGAEFLASGDTGLVINSDAASSGADWSLSVARPSTGMTAAWTLTLPTTPGAANQVLQTNGSGVTTWVDAVSGATDITISTPLTFGDGATVSIGTLPAHAVILAITMVVDTAFTGGTATASVGLTSDNSKYMGTGDMNLGIAAGWAVTPNLPPDASTEALNIYYTAGGTTAGSARLLINYSVPV